MMKQGVLHALKILLMIVTGAVAATVLLTLVFLVPVNEQNKAQSMQMLSEEGWYPLAGVHQSAGAEYFHSFLPNVTDSNTDSIMVSIAADDSEGNALVRAMNMYNAYMGKDYARYWHGYVSILRPLLCFFDYSEIRIINGLLQALLAFFLAHVLWEKKGRTYALLALTSYALLMPPALSASLYFSGNYYVATIGSLVLLKGNKNWEEKSGYLYVFAGIGMATCFFDLLTYPLYTWGIPVIWWLLTWDGEKSVWQSLKKCILSGVAWIAGYFGIWVMKWLLAGAITGRNVLADATDKMSQWSATGEQTGQTLGERMAALSMNWNHYQYPVYMVILLAWIVCLTVMLTKNGIRFHKNNLALLLVAASSVVWYIVMSEHTMGHHFFAYRIWGIAILTVLGILLQALPAERTESKWSLRGRWQVLVCFVVAALMAAGLTLTTREEITAFDGNVEYTKVEIAEGASAEMSFMPTFSKVKFLMPCMYSEGTEGAYEILVRKGEEVLYTEQIPVAKYEGKTYTSIAVDWKLKAGDEYLLEIRPIDTKGPVYLLMTKPEAQPLKEWGDVTIDGAPAEGQPVIGFTYRTLATSKKTLLFMFACYGAVSMAVILGAGCLGRRKAEI